MACYHPIRAWRSPSGEILISKQERKDCLAMRLPCGGCLGCRMASAQAWALRCQLELQQHKSAVFTTLTYDDEHLPLTLQKEALPVWIRALRKHKGTKSIRFFACGEYGERTNRPHYHAILYGLSLKDEQLIQDKWADRNGNILGHTRTEPISPARIAYTAGYCQKKIGYKREPHERVSPDGEPYTWQPPFKLMSRRPGIGGEARQWANSWRLFAIKDGHKMPVPRYLHEAWKQQATIQQKEQLAYEKSQLALNKDLSNERLLAAEQIAIKRHQQQGENRTL